MYSRTKVFAHAAAVAFTCIALPLPAIAQTCKSALSAPAVKPEIKPEDLEQALKVVPAFDGYFSRINERILERQYLAKVAELALIAKEHLLLVGPPGNAKSQFADETLGGIRGIDGKPSYYRIQMTPETTLSETHGPLDFKTLNETGEYKRLTKEGALHSKSGFFDEIFDARANAHRNILGLLAERIHAQGPNIEEGEIETFFAASNRYLSEVYKKAGDDGPKAVIDRFAFVAFVPAAFEWMDSYVTLIQNAGINSERAKGLIFEDLDQLRKLVPQIEIPVRVAKFLALLSIRVEEETASLELAAKKAYEDKLRNGEDPGIPFRATKYFSLRTIGKSSKILRAIVVRAWMKDPKRHLRATTDDIKDLEAFATLNGPSDDFVNHLLSRSNNPDERAQYMTILQERDIFRRQYERLQNEVNQVTISYALTDLYNQVDSAKTEIERSKLAEKLMNNLFEVRKEIEADKHKRAAELNGHTVGLDLVEEFLLDSLGGILGEKRDEIIAARFAQLQTDWKKSVEAEEAEKRAEEERSANALKTQQQIATQQRQAKLAEKKRDLLASLNDTAKWSTLYEMEFELPEVDQHAFAFDAKARAIYHYSRRKDTVTRLTLADGKRSTRQAGVNGKLDTVGARLAILPGDRVLIFDSSYDKGQIVTLGRGPTQKFSFDKHAVGSFVPSADNRSLYTLDLAGLTLQKNVFEPNTAPTKDSFDLSQEIDLGSSGLDRKTLLYDWGLQKAPGAIRLSADGTTLFFTDQLFENTFAIDLAKPKIRWISKVARPKGRVEPAGRMFGVDAVLPGNGLLSLTENPDQPMKYFEFDAAKTPQLTLWPELDAMVAAGESEHGQGLFSIDLAQKDARAKGKPILGSEITDVDSAPLYPVAFADEAIAYFIKSENGKWKLRFIQLKK